MEFTLWARERAPSTSSDCRTNTLPAGDSFEWPDDILPKIHRARLIWRALRTFDLSLFVKDAHAVDGSVGREVLSPAIMRTLWVYAISIGVGSARAIMWRTRADDAFWWIVGEKEVVHSALSAFVIRHRRALDGLTMDVLGALVHKGLLLLESVSQDGTRVRAIASAPSFRCAVSLRDCRKQAELCVQAALADLDEEANEAERRARIAATLVYQKRDEATIQTVQELCDEGKKKPAHRQRMPCTCHEDAPRRAGVRGHRGANRPAPSSACCRRRSRKARMHRSSDTSRR